MNPTFPPSALVVFDIDGVLRNVSGSYRRALADTVERFTDGAYRPTPADIDRLKSEGIWNNDWEGSRELIYRYFEGVRQERSSVEIDYNALIAFFQSRYFGPDRDNWTGYICHEPLLVRPEYFHNLTAAGIPWGFFSGATRNSAGFVLSQRLGLPDPLLVAMEDAPGKPDPTGLLAVATQLSADETVPVIYAGDTVGDLYTVEKAARVRSERAWIGVGILPPHAMARSDGGAAYAQTLREAGAKVVLNNIEELTPELIGDLARS